MDTRISGPSIDDPEVEEAEVFFTSGEIARLAQAAYSDVQNWARLGYIKNSGKLGRWAKFRDRQIRKAQLMALLIRRMSAKADDASRTADELIKLYENRPEGFRATVALAQIIGEGLLADLISLILDLNLTPKLIEMLRAPKESSG